MLGEKRSRGLRVLVAGLVAGAVVSAAAASQAYELDTHFYDTYAMAREAGFKHDYARFLALGSEWVDKGISSTPVGGAIVGTLLRRIWHFPGYRYRVAVPREGEASKLSKFTGKFTFKSITTFNHPVAHKLFDEGMRQSNWMKIALSIHTIQDSAGHSGYTDTLGHLEFGHNPDRTWLAGDKYQRMTGLVFKLLVALRQVAPGEALEGWALKERARPVTDQDASRLQESFWKKMAPLVTRDYFKDPRYTPEAVNTILREARKNGYIVENEGFRLEKNLPTAKDYLVDAAGKPGLSPRKDPTFANRKDARAVLKDWVTQKRAAEIQKGILVKGSVFNMAVLDNAGYRDVRLALQKVEQQVKDPQERARRYREIVTPEITRDVISWTVDDFTRGQIPHKFDDYVHVAFEANSVPRKIEKKLKEQDRQEHIKKTYGADVQFGKQGDTFTRKDRLGAMLVKWGHNLRTAVRDISRRGVSSHGCVKGYQCAAVLNDKVKSGEYPRLGELSKRNVLGRSPVRTDVRTKITHARAKLANAKTKVSGLFRRP